MAAIDTSFQMTPPVRAQRRSLIPEDSLTRDIIYSWFFMRAATRRLIVSRPDEGKLLFLLLVSDMVFLFSWTVRVLLVPQSPGAWMFEADLGLLVMMAFGVRTAAMYVFAMILGAFCRLIGGRGTWRNTRIALFWAALVSAPFGFAAALLTVGMNALSVSFPVFGAHWIASAPFFLAFVPLLYFTAQATAQAQGFARSGAVFLYLSLATLAGLMFALYFQATVLI